MAPEGGREGGVEGGREGGRQGRFPLNAGCRSNEGWRFRLAFLEGGRKKGAKRSREVRKATRICRMLLKGEVRGFRLSFFGGDRREGRRVKGFPADTGCRAREE